MNDTPVMTSTVIGEEGAKVTSEGLRIEIRLPWYRSLPVSTVEIDSVAIDGKPVEPGEVTFELADRKLPLVAMAEQTDWVWYVLDSAYLHVKARPEALTTAREVTVAMSLYPPYIRGLRRITKDTRPIRQIRFGTTLYALTNEFLARRYNFEQLLEQTAARGIGPGVEVVGYQSIRGFPEVTDQFADRFKQLVAQYRLTPTALGINADEEIRRGTVMSTEEKVAYHEPQLRAAAKLGFPVARYQHGASPEVIRRLVPLAEKLGVKLGLEIHAPHHANHPDVLKYREMYTQVNSPYLGWIPDFSATGKTVPPSLLASLRKKGVSQSLIDLAMEVWHEPGDPKSRMGRYKERARAAGAPEVQLNELSLIFSMFGHEDPRGWAELMPAVVHIHGKFFGFDANGNEEAIDYASVLPVFREGGYNGFMSSEWEGHAYSGADAFDMVTKHQAMCRRILGAG